MSIQWLADRTRAFDSSGIRKVFDLARQMKDPINFSIGQPDYDVPEPVRQAMIDAVQSRKNAYSVTQGIPVLRDKLQAQIDSEYQQSDRKVFVASGTSGGLVLAALSLVNPGDEVIFFDPYFLMYPPLVRMAGGVPVTVDTAPDFSVDPERLLKAITPKTKMIILNSPANPTGIQLSEQSIRTVAEIAYQKNIALVSDEIYRAFCYDAPFVSPAKYNPNTIVIDGFSKSHGMTGWRLGFVHGPTAIIETMLKLQQYTFVCAPQPVQWAGAAAMDVDMTSYVDAYRLKRDKIYNALKDLYEIVKPNGAFYMYPKLPWGTGESFIKTAIENELLIIPGNIFSQHDTHFRISYAADDRTLDRGIEVLRRIARK